MMNDVWDTDMFELFDMNSVSYGVARDWQRMSAEAASLRLSLRERNKYLVVYFDAMRSKRLRDQPVRPDHDLELTYAAPCLSPIYHADAAVVLYPSTIKVIKNRKGFGVWNNLFLKLAVREKMQHDA